MRVSALALAVAGAGACGAEHFPAPLTRADAGVDAAIGDASPDVVVDAEPLEDAGVDATEDHEVVDAGACNVRLDTPPIAASPHVPEGTVITYNSNPPSSGPHYPIWANYQEFTQPVDDGYLVHSMEHGGVLLLYKCDADASACADTVAALRAVRDAVPDDPNCDPSIRVRIIIAPRPANDVAVAAAAWGNTYRADCVDAPSLAAFITAHYAQGPESLCASGMLFP
jgi:hypothetical protein